MNELKLILYIKCVYNSNSVYVSFNILYIVKIYSYHFIINEIEVYVVVMNAYV